MTPKRWPLAKSSRPEAMAVVEAHIKQLPHLGKSYVDIVPTPPLSGALNYFRVPP